MNKTTYVKTGLVLLFIFMSLQLFAQNFVPFTPRFENQILKGDIQLIGNNILGPNNIAFNDSLVFNHNVNMVYIDIDGDASTFNSSSADLTIPNPGCYRIIHAGLYWGAVTEGSEPFNTIKFRGPAGGYNDITGTIIFDANGTTVDGGDSFPYACFADVTDIVTGLGTDLGTYTVGNVSSAQGRTSDFGNNTGHSAGWSLYIVYEDPTLPGKSITSFDGFSAISIPGGNPTLDVTVSGFQTVPAPLPVRANFAFATLEGDSPILGDQLLLNDLNLSTADRPETNFFNSSVTQLSALPVNNRNPNSANTLGFDTGVIVVPNPANAVIANGATDAKITLETRGDTYFPYFFSLAVDIIEPNIVLTKTVEDPAGNDIGGMLVNLGDELNYVLGFQNTGNDDATAYVIRDILPTNIVFDYPLDLGILPAGITHSYNATTRELVFNIDNTLVEENDPLQEIRFKVTVVSECSLLNDACSNIILNQAFSTYQGTLNPAFIISDDPDTGGPEPSFNTNTGCLLTPGATNFLADIDCVFEEEVILCGASTVLTSGSGYDLYSWSTSPSGTPVIGTTQSITVTETGTYYVSNTAIAPCQSTEQEFEVITFGAGVTNPVIPFADNVAICPNDGKELPNIFLCGGNGPRLIDTNITDTTSIIWEQLDETSCDAVINRDCANENSACTWNEIETGPSYMADTAGQFRLTLNYDGGCFNQFYFNVYTNLLVPRVDSRDIYCDTPGEIRIDGVPNGYEYGINEVSDTDPVTYQTDNVFSVDTAGIYVISIKQIDVDPNPCIFTVPNVQIRQTSFTVSTNITQPLCNGDLGSILIAANDVRPQYFFSISQGLTEVNSVGPITPSDYTFSNLNPGIYTINVRTEDNCLHTEDIEIIEPDLLEATSGLTTPLTCTDGEITVYPTGGTAPYFYFVNGATAFQTVPTIPVTSTGVFNILVVDNNNCTAETSITVEAIPAPDFTVDKADIACSDTGDVGSITFNVSNPNGNTLAYSIDNGVTFSNSNVFPALAEGTYQTIIQYSIGADVCTTTPEEVTITTLATVRGIATLTTDYGCTTDGVITVSGVTGGTAPYTYSLDGVNFQPGTTFTGLRDGTYNVTIRDFSGCAFIEAPIVIEALNPPIDLDFNSSPVSCPAITSDVTITGTTGGNPTLEYQITAPLGSATAYQTSNVFSGLSPDTYTFQVRDEDGCTYIETFTIAPLPSITVSTVITKNLDCTTSPDGTITGTISGGIAPFTYAVSFNGATFSGSNPVTGTTFTHAAPTDGTYQFQITDANSCIAESGVQTINAIILVTASDAVSNPTCNGSSDGSFIITPLTGQGPFTYSIDGGTTFVSSNTFGGQVAGSYNYIVRDSKDCETTGTAVLVDPAPIDVTIIRNPIQCNSNIPGSLDVTINSGGIAPFVYTLFDNTFTQIGASVTTTVTNNTFSGLSFGDYYVTIVDDNGCEFLSTRQRIDTPPNIQLDGNVSSGSCATGATVDISVITGTGPFIYSIFGQPGTSFGPTSLTSHTFSGLNHGVTYQFQVIDSGACFSIREVTTPTLSAIDISPITPTNVNCNGADDGTVSFTVSNYDPSVTTLYYEVQDELTNAPITPAQNGTVTGLTGAAENATITGLAPGNYTLFVREADGTLCTAAEVFQIREPIQPLFSAVSEEENANCNFDAQVTLNTTGGTGPYQYAIGAPGFVPVLTDFGPSNVLNLDYSIRTNWDIVIIDANGCDFRVNETIDIDQEPIVAAILNDQCDIEEGNFVIDVTLTTAGIAPYTYSIDGGTFQTRTAPFSISNLASGTHTVAIRDANGCGNLVSVNIETPLEIMTSSITALPTCNNDDGEITIIGTGGTGSYSYTISPNPASISLTGNVFSGVPSGTYTVIITDTVTMCSDDVTVILAEAIPLRFNTSPSQVTCFGANDGEFELNVSGYTGAYSYEVFDSASVSVYGVVNANTSTNPELVSGLLAGTYSVVITETASPFCSAPGNVIIPSPPEALILMASETSNVTCDNDKGTITATATGGRGTYEYELTGTATAAYSSNGTFTDLSAGAYTVNVRDAGGCIVPRNVQLDLPTPIDGSINATPNLLSCFGDSNADIIVSAVTGGQNSNYSYTLNMISPTVSASGPQTDPVFSGLGIGTYNVTITDGYNCEFTTTNVVITQPAKVEANLIKVTPQTCTTQATLTLSASGGTGIYEYSDTASFATVIGTFATSTTFSVTPGTYAYYVRDVNRCTSTVSNDIAIDPLSTLTVSLDTTNTVINCAGDDNGTIIASAKGGLGNYIYTLQDTLGNPIALVTQDSPGVFTNLPVGDYQVQVDSGTDCLEGSEVAPITNASEMLDVMFDPIPESCNGENDGMLEITIRGGSGTIKYAISPQLEQFIDIETVKNLVPGNYDIVVQDELGCFVIHNFDIEPAPPIIFNYTIISESPCDGDETGEFTIDIQGGRAPYSVSLDNITYMPLPLGTNTFTFEDLEGGEKMVYVLDDAMCGGDSPFSIPLAEPVIIDPIADVDYACTNDFINNTNTVTNKVTVTVDDSITDTSVLEYALDGGTFATGTGIFENVAPGLHTISVRHPNGCVKITDNDIPFEIETFQPLTLILNDGGLNEIVAVASNGAEPYEYRLNDGAFGDENTFLIFESGNYTVTVIDANGCEVSVTRFFEYVDVCIPNYFVPQNGGWGPGCAEQYRNLTFDIFDRYGRKIASLNIGDKWDGTYRGKELPSGDYWYVVKLNEPQDKREFVGHFTLYR